ncbi:Phorbol ester/diacylglycerol-binding protein unc-13 [Balamuthia mandrillaris]
MPYTIRIRVIECQHLIAADVGGKSDPYVTVTVEGTTVKTETIKKSLSPTFNQSFDLTLRDLSDPWVIFQVFDWDRFGSHDRLGCVVVSLGGLIQGLEKDRWFKLQGVSQGDIHVGITAVDFGYPPGQFQGYPPTEQLPATHMGPVPTGYKVNKKGQLKFAKTQSDKNKKKAKKGFKKFGKALAAGIEGGQ